MRARLRVDESVSEARALRAEVSAWRARWDTIDAMGGHPTQLDLLTDVVLGRVDEITARSAAIDMIFSADLGVDPHPVVEWMPHRPHPFTLLAY